MTTRRNAFPLTVLMLTLALAAFFGSGCSDDPASPADNSLATVDKDAAQAIAADVATDSGGVTDQMNDIALVIDALNGAKSMHPGHPDTSWVRDRFREASYDTLTGTWTITVSREAGIPDGSPYHAMSRVFTLRLLTADGRPQPFRIVDQDTAATAEYAIVSGTGVHRTVFREHVLNELNGAFTITGLDQPLLVINGSYHRDASHALETPRFSRTLDGVLDVVLTDVTVARAPRADFCDAISGTISGTWVADITVTHGDDYSEQHVERDITIVLGDCEAEIHCGGGLFRVPLGSGQMPR